MDPPIQTEYFLSGGAMDGPHSSYSCLEIHICWKVEREARMDPPIQTEYFLSGGAVISFCIRSAIPGYMVVPPDMTVLAYRSLRMSTSHFMMELKVVSWMPQASIPRKEGWKRASGQRKRSLPMVSRRDLTMRQCACRKTAQKDSRRPDLGAIRSMRQCACRKTAQKDSRRPGAAMSPKGCENALECKREAGPANVPGNGPSAEHPSSRSFMAGELPCWTSLALAAHSRRPRIRAESSLAPAQMARTKAILLTKSARL